MREALTITDRPSLFSYFKLKGFGGSNPSPSARGLSFAAALLCLACSASAVQVGDVISFAGDGGLRQVTLTQTSGERMFLGTLDGYAGVLNAVLTETDRGWRMSVDDWRPAKTWVIVNEDGRTDVRSCAKPRRTAGSCRRYVPPREAPPETSRPLFRSVASGGLTAGWEVDSVTNEIDILVVFDKSAMLRLARMECTAETFAAEQIAKMNAALANSGLSDDFRVTLAGVFKAGFDVTRDCGRDEDDFLYKALENVCEGSLSKWKGIRDERDRLGADAVVVLVDPDWTLSPEEDASGTVGISCGLENDPEHGLFGPTHELLSELREYAYSVCNICAVTLDHTFAHEVGHIMGAGHSELLSPFYSSPGPQLFPYSAAQMYLDPVDAGYYYTVMGYDSADGSFYSPVYAEVPCFSSPVLRHPETGTALGDAYHDNVRSLREMYAVISQYRVNAARREAPIEPSAVWKKSRTLMTVAEGDVARGVVKLRIGAMNKRTGRVTVSGTFTGLDGRNIALRQQEKTVVVENDQVAVTLASSKHDLEFSVVVTPEGAVGGGSGLVLTSGKTVGGALPAGTLTFRLDPDFTVGGEGEELTELLPFEKAFQATEKKWIFDKAALVRLVRNRQTKLYELSINTSSGRTNLSALKLTYTAKTGLFRGTFKAYSLANVKGRDRLMSYVVTVTGLVVDGHGTGLAVCKKTGATASVVLQTP